MSVPVLSMADIPVNVESVHSVVSGASGDMTRARVRAGGDWHRYWQGDGPVINQTAQKMWDEVLDVKSSVPTPMELRICAPTLDVGLDRCRVSWGEDENGRCRMR